MKKYILAILALLSAYGCATNTLSVTYFSDPPGATLYQGNQRLGYSPITLLYGQVADEQKKRGRTTIKGISAQWASGATTSFSTFDVILSNGLTQQFTFIRPSGYPGRETDERFALEIEKLNAMRRQSEAQEAQAAVQLFGGLGQPRKPATTNCVSRPSVLGGSVSTTCY